jgi:hypothetical protein
MLLDKTNNIITKNAVSTKDDLKARQHMLSNGQYFSCHLELHFASIDGILYIPEVVVHACELI